MLDLSIPPLLASIVDARSQLVGLPDPEPAEAREDLELLVTELLSNSVQHADLCPHARIRLRVSELPPVLRVEVSDPGCGCRPQARAPSADAPCGRGLLLVQRIARRWGVVLDGGSRVWFELPWQTRRHAPERELAGHANGVVTGPSRSRSLS